MGLHASCYSIAHCTPDAIRAFVWRFLLIGSFGSGYAAGRRTVEEVPRSTIELQSKEQIHVTLLRCLDRGVLVKPSPKDVALFISWAEIRSVTTPVAQHRFRGFLCSRFAVACLKS